MTAEEQHQIALDAIMARHNPPPPYDPEQELANALHRIAVLEGQRDEAIEIAEILQKQRNECKEEVIADVLALPEIPKHSSAAEAIRKLTTEGKGE